MLDKLASDGSHLPPERFAELRFEALERVADHRKRRRAVPQEVAETVARHGRPQLPRCGYPRRDGAAAGP